jgi:hypothetical protein
MPNYNFSIDNIEIRNTRSRGEDTIYISACVAIAGRQPVNMVKKLGDHNNGSFSPGINLDGISIADDEIAVFSYVIINNGHTQENVVLNRLADSAVALAQAGANAAVGVAATAVGGAVGAAIGALLGTSLPVIGTLIGGALGAVAGNLLGDIFGSINPNCDGPLGSAVNYVTGQNLRNQLEAGNIFGQTDHNEGVDSPHGCGSNSDYYTTWSITKT